MTSDLATMMRNLRERLVVLAVFAHDLAMQPRCPSTRRARQRRTGYRRRAPGPRDGAVLNGEISPATFKPIIGVSIARELINIVERGNRRFHDSLRDDQRAKLAEHPFDFGDYLIFSTPWEDALKFLD